MVFSSFGAGSDDDQDGYDGQEGISSAAAAVAYAGSLPLIAGAVLAWARFDMAEMVLGWMSIYGIILLGFFGGVRWGVAVMGKKGPGFRQLVGATVPFAIALVAYGFEASLTRLAILVVVIPILLVDDLRATQRGSGAPSWYLSVRVPLTLMMELSFIAALALAMKISM